MAKSSPTRHLFALALALIFALGAALPGACSSTHEGHAASHSATSCAKLCHASAVKAASARTMSDRLPLGSDLSVSAASATGIAHAELPVYQRVTPLAARAMPDSPATRLHLLHAVFLN